jgi:hypothetical protein
MSGNPLFPAPTRYTDQGATLSEDQLHRYRCWRTWGPAAPLGWLMLNPSTADALVLDPMLRRVEGFSRREGAGGFEVWNLWSLRSTDPTGLWTWMVTGDRQPDYDANVAAIDAELPRFRRVVCAWGSFSAVPKILRRGAEEVARATVRRLQAAGVETLCIVVNADGQPKHPLYTAGDAPLLPFRADP